MDEIKVIKANDDAKQLERIKKEREVRRIQIRVLKKLLWMASVVMAFAIGMVIGRLLAFLYAMGY